MDWISRMNKVIDYIENNYFEIDRTAISRIMASPYSLFLRTFAPITGISFSEYLRLRRLSLAAHELITTNSRIIDIAVKYGYSSADAFSSAFKKFHGISPSAARKQGSQLVFYPRLNLTLNLEGITDLKYRVESYPAFSVMGIKMKVPENSNAWILLNSHPKEPALTEISGHKLPLGICFGYDADGNNDYMCACKNISKIQHCFDSYDFPSLTYLIFTAKGSISQDVFHQTENRIYKEFIPQCMYKVLDLPVIQHFIQWDPASDFCNVEFMLPIQNQGDML